MKYRAFYISNKMKKSFTWELNYKIWMNDNDDGIVNTLKISNINLIVTFKCFVTRNVRMKCETERKKHEKYWKMKRKLSFHFFFSFIILLNLNDIKILNQTKQNVFLKWSISFSSLYNFNIFPFLNSLQDLYLNAACLHRFIRMQKGKLTWVLKSIPRAFNLFETKKKK